MSTRWANILLTQDRRAKERGVMFLFVKEVSSLTKRNEAKCFLSLHLGRLTVKFDHFRGRILWSISIVLMGVVELKRSVTQ
jgi:hypothetical protein